MNAETRLARELAQEIERLLSRLGLLFRVFHRVKELNSVSEKVKRKGYLPSGRKLQDYIGVRIVLYFSDDVEIVEHALRSKYSIRSVTRDEHGTGEFRPQRLNLIYQLPETLLRDLPVLKSRPEIDATFEVQLRTILAEGWHEVEHDLRYKCPSDWDENEDLSRALNGIVATLETCDWSILQLFDELSLRQYRKQEWAPMLRHKFRLRLADLNLKMEIGRLFEVDGDLAKQFFRVDRKELLLKMIDRTIDLPLTADNLVFVANWLFVHDDRISSLMPKPIAMKLEP